MKFTLTFDKNTYKPEIVESYAKGTGIFNIKIDDVYLLKYPSGSMFMQVAAHTNSMLTADGDNIELKDHILNTARLYVGKWIDKDNMEEGFGMNIFRSLLGVTKKSKATAKPYNKELHGVGRDVEVHYFPALQGVKCNVYIQEEYSLYDDSDGNEKLSIKMVIKRFYNELYKTATEILENMEAEAYLKDLDRYKIRYLDDLDEEIVKTMLSNRTTSNTSTNDEDDDDLDTSSDKEERRENKDDTDDKDDLDDISDDDVSDLLD